MTVKSSARRLKDGTNPMPKKGFQYPNFTQRTEIGLFLFNNPDPGFYSAARSLVNAQGFINPCVVTNKKEMMVKWLKKNNIINMVAVCVKPGKYNCFMMMVDHSVIEAVVAFKDSENSDTRIKNVVSALFRQCENS